MVFQLLAFCGCMAKYGTAGHYNIRAGICHTGIYHKVFLLPTEGGGNLGYIFIKILGYIHGGFIQCHQGFDQWGFCIQRFAGIGNKYGRDA